MTGVNSRLHGAASAHPGIYHHLLSSWVKMLPGEPKTITFHFQVAASLKAHTHQQRQEQHWSLH